MENCRIVCYASAVVAYSLTRTQQIVAVADITSNGGIITELPSDGIE